MKDFYRKKTLTSTDEYDTKGYRWAYKEDDIESHEEDEEMRWYKRHYEECTGVSFSTVDSVDIPIRHCTSNR